MLKKFFNKNSLGHKLLIRVLFASTLITTFLTIANFSYDFYKENKKINDSIQEIESTSLNAISNAMWDVDNEQIVSQINGLLNIKHILNIEVLETDKSVFAKTKLKSDPDRYSKIISFDLRKNNQTIGTLNVTLTTKYVYQDILRRLFIFFLVQGIKTLLVSFIIMYLFYHMIGKKVEHFSNFFETYAHKKASKLDPKEWKKYPESEIAKLGENINLLIDEVNKRDQEQIKEIKTKSEYLDNAESIARIGSWSFDIQTKKILWSNEMFSLFNFDQTQNEPSFDELSTRIHKDDLELWEKQIASSIFQGKDYKIRYRVYTIKSETDFVWIESKAKAIKDRNGKTFLLQGTCQDVTENEISKKKIKDISDKLSNVLDLTPVGIFETDLSGKYMYANKTWSEISEIDFNTIKGQSWISCFSEDIELKDWKQEIEANGLFNKTIEIKDINQKSKFIEIRLLPMDQQEENKFIGVLINRTEEINNEKELEKQKKLNTHNAKLASIGELAAGVGHEINNPLTIVNGYIANLEQALKKDNIDKEDFNSKILKIKMASSRILKIVQGLRTFSRNDVNNEVENFNPMKAVQESFNLVKEIYQNDGIELSINDDTTENKMLCANIGKFQQIVMNLLSNAKDAVSSKDKKIIEITLENIQDELKLSFRDNGQGIPEKFIDRIFDPFFTTKDVNKGTGIGLSIVHNFILEMDGRLEVESKFKEGTIFKIYFPLVDEVSTIIPIHNQEQENLNVNILIADDEEDILSLLKLILENQGARVSTASNGIDAYNLFLENDFDMIISDIKMPEMDGVSLYKKIKKQKDKNMPKFIMITGGVNTDLNNSQDPYFKKIDGFFYKPFDHDTVIKTIHHAFKDHPIKKKA